MTKISRNAPCPCGSGKKYKQCCLRRERKPPDPQERNAPEIALDWALGRYGDEIAEIVEEEFLGGLDDEARARMPELPEGIHEMLQINIGEWILAEGSIEVDGEDHSVTDLVLGPGGPLLNARQRCYLETLACCPMGLYEVVESDPGRGVWLRDVLDPDAPRQWVGERTASRTLRQWDILGARLIPGEPWEFSGALYPIPRLRYSALLADLRRELGASRSAELARAIVSTLIINDWLQVLTAPPPRIVDASSGEPLLLVNDHYRVPDWDRLAAALAVQDDVEGDREEGWTWFSTLDDEERRSRLALHPEPENRLVAFARTLAMADEGRRWLEEIAGDAVSHLTREIEDPRQCWSKRHQPSPEADAAGEMPELPPGVRQELTEHMYRDWAETPIPALGGKSPRDALATEEGLQAVVELLKTYEHEELRGAEHQGREPVDYGFLWQALGLDRDRLLDIDQAPEALRRGAAQPP